MKTKQKKSSQVKCTCHSDSAHSYYNDAVSVLLPPSWPPPAVEDKEVLTESNYETICWK